MLSMTTLAVAQEQNGLVGPGLNESVFSKSVQGMKKSTGYFDLWLSNDQAKVFLAVKELNKPFLLVTSLPYGLGSNDVGLDRGQVGTSKLVHFEKHGKRLFLVQENTRFVADSHNPDERASVREAFSGAVLWSADIIASEGSLFLIDFSSFLVADRHGVVDSLSRSRQGNYVVDEKRSAVLTQNAKNFPDNTELEALLTFSGLGEGQFVRQVAIDQKSLRMHQHVSLVRLPEGYTARPYHPGSGGIDSDRMDFATPLAESITVQWQLRHRLEKLDPTAAVSGVKKPIVYYLDRGAPEPVRTALMEGASWWGTAFEKAGFKDAYRVELLPEGVDPMDIRYNTIMWVHRATRGWSYGNAVSDPRTGEIIKGAVTLGSQRVRQDILIAESLLAPYGKTTSEEKKRAAEQMALARLRQLAAHEVGHTLGIAHNFAPSRQGNGSVMDYPHPIVKLNAQGEPELNTAYGVGVGPWDEFVIQHLYSNFPGQNETLALANLRAKAKASGLQYVADSDSRAPGAAHPNGLLWDFGADSLQTYDQLMQVRQRALSRFSTAVLPPQRQLGELEARLVPLYLLHRYQIEGVARLIAGAEYEYGLAQDANEGRVTAGAKPVAAATQRQALQKIADSLRAEQLALPQNVLDILTPQSEGYSRTPEYFSGKMNVIFDALSAVEAGSAQSCQFLFDPSRINRLSWQHARDIQQLGVSELLQQVFERTWKRSSVPSNVVAGEAVQLASNWVVLDAVLNLIDSGRLHPQVQAEVRANVADLAQWLQKNPSKGSISHSRRQAADLILSYLREPTSVKLRGLPLIPPGAPI
ncbi:zinc-dependent metalloprotease [Undibacterium sp. FT137W]|uniref:Zinc-dependent metalloprotease n=2 Tax=Undibacterium fentianense TaxID=2828728 RepID=A0A941IF54_9BURK|nr:zinc-dependent metalloprotease [Undibacterium fentianense]